ncbi:MAG: hypothetical protein HJJLKODD_00602 [Phycisphaerae bacterium]|nr:hypothetical protein [Phycisphaerae bacterium]
MFRCGLSRTWVLVVVGTVWTFAGCGPGGGNDNIDNTNDNVVDNTNDNVVDNTNDNVVDNTNDNEEPLGERAFVGAAACAACHPGTHDDWAGTIHSTALESLKEIGQDTNAECLPCHTVGFEADGYVDEERTPEFAGVQCENCHGSAKEHIASPATVKPTVSLAADVCGACHTGEHHPNFEQWQQAGHATIQQAVIDDLTIEGGSTTNTCGICHVGDVFVAVAVKDEVVEETAFVGLTGEDLTPISCAVCHNPHAQTGNAVNPTEGRDYQLRFPQVANPEPSNEVDVVTSRDRMNACGQCHHSRGRVWTATTRGPHHSEQGNIYIGEMATPDDSEPLVENTASVHAGVPSQCTTCHMYRKDFESEEAPTISGHLFSVNTEACVMCHGTPEAAQALLDDLSAEVDAALLDIETRLGDPLTWQYSAEGGPPEEADAAEGEFSQADVSDEIKQVRFLWALVEADGSKGTHNPEYVRSILAKADELLDGLGM